MTGKTEGSQQLLSKKEWWTQCFENSQREAMNFEKPSVGRRSASDRTASAVEMSFVSGWEIQTLFFKEADTLLRVLSSRQCCAGSSCQGAWPHRVHLRAAEMLAAWAGRDRNEIKRLSDFQNSFGCNHVVPFERREERSLSWAADVLLQNPSAECLRTCLHLESGPLKAGLKLTWSPTSVT